jgi:SAM-dependent methyltransferase
MSVHVHQWLDGLKGIELGRSATNDYGLRCWNVAPDDEHAAPYRQAEITAVGRAAPIDRVDDGETLATFADATLDFVFSSHVFEHMANPLGALLTWCRVLRPGGLVYLIVPQRDALEADAVRPLTTTEHLVGDWVRGETFATHPVDPGHGVRGHYHRFTSGSLRAAIRDMIPPLTLVDLLDPDDQAGNGFALVYRTPEINP